MITSARIPEITTNIVVVIVTVFKPNTLLVLDTLSVLPDFWGPVFRIRYDFRLRFRLTRIPRNPKDSRNTSMVALVAALMVDIIVVWPLAGE